ncbi:hypothetical protein BDW75DRAFT_138369 [Aspergillus navahoensis]
MFLPLPFQLPINMVSLYTHGLSIDLYGSSSPTLGDGPFTKRHSPVRAQCYKLLR